MSRISFLLAVMLSQIMPFILVGITNRLDTFIPLVITFDTALVVIVLWTTNKHKGVK